MYAAVAAILVGLRRNDPTGRAVWLCFAAGVFGNASGILVEQVDTELLGGDGFPSIADVFFLSLYRTVALGLAILIRRRTAREDWARWSTKHAGRNRLRIAASRSDLDSLPLP